MKGEIAEEIRVTLADRVAELVRDVGHKAKERGIDGAHYHSRA